jgi:uncharacterized damage-inducible protein DinB
MASARVHQLLEALQAAAAELEAAALAVPGELLYRRPAPDEWSVMEILAHMADSPRFYAAEIRRLLRAGGGTFGRPLDAPERLAPIRAHAQDTLDEALARNRAAVAEVAALLAALSETDLAVRGTHLRQGEFDIAGLVTRFVIDHRRDHARQIRATVAALGGAPRA